MKERFKQLPEPLQQQVIRRFAVAIVFVLLFFITLFGFWDAYLFLPCLLFAGFFIVNALRLFYSADALLLIRDEKISAVHSGDEVDYSILPIDELLKVLQAKLDADEKRPVCQPLPVWIHKD